MMFPQTLTILNNDSGIINRQIPIHPHLNIPFLINTDLIFLNDKILRMLVDPRIPFQTLHEHVQVVGEGDIADLAQPHLHMFDIDGCHVGMGANLFMIFLDEELGIYDVLKFAAPVVGF